METAQSVALHFIGTNRKCAIENLLDNTYAFCTHKLPGTPLKSRFTPLCSTSHLARFQNEILPSSHVVRHL